MYQVERSAFELEFAFLDFAEVENICNDIQQRVPTPLDNLQTVRNIKGGRQRGGGREESRGRAKRERKKSGRRKRGRGRRRRRRRSRKRRRRGERGEEGKKRNIRRVSPWTREGGCS